MTDLTPLAPYELLDLRTRLVAGLATGGLVIVPIVAARRLMLAAPDVFYQADAYAITRATEDRAEIPLEGLTLHLALMQAATAAQHQPGPWPAIVRLEQEAAAILTRRISGAPPMADPGKYTARSPDLSGRPAPAASQVEG